MGGATERGAAAQNIRKDQSVCGELVCSGEQLYFPWAPEVMKGGNPGAGLGGACCGADSRARLPCPACGLTLSKQQRENAWSGMLRKGRKRLLGVTRCSVLLSGCHSPGDIHIPRYNQAVYFRFVGSTQACYIIIKSWCQGMGPQLSGGAPA